MLDRRMTRAALAAVAAVLVLRPGLPALADPGNPSPSELAAARRAVTAAKASVASLQTQAEAATEAFNGAMVAAQSAERASAEASTRAATAAADEARAQGVAAGAQAVSDTAQAREQRKRDEQDAAEGAVRRQQTTLDRMAAGAYTTGGQLSQIGSVLNSSNPASVTQGASYLDRVGAYQRGVVVDVQRARNRVTTAAQLAAAASAEAKAAADAAQAALDKASAAAAVAATARQAADRATTTAKHALLLASTARSRARYLVSRADDSLGNATQRARRLEAAAATARAAATTVTSGTAPSDAAATAISWAFQEIGVPYSWGGGDQNGPTYGIAQGAGIKGFDCSGLTLFAYAHAGIRLDHWTGSQWKQGKRISSRADLQPGDLMFFATDTSDPSTIHHMSMYIGSGKMIEAPYTGEVVRVASYDRSDFIGATRPWA